MTTPEEPQIPYAGDSPEPVETEYPDPVFLDDPDRSGREGPAATDPGIETVGETIVCPWCGTEQDLFLEPSGEASREEFVEKCPGCTREFEVRVGYDDAGTPHVHADRAE